MFRRMSHSHCMLRGAEAGSLWVGCRVVSTTQAHTFKLCISYWHKLTIACSSGEHTSAATTAPARKGTLAGGPSPAVPPGLRLACSRGEEVFQLSTSTHSVSTGDTVLCASSHHWGAPAVEGKLRRDLRPSEPPGTRGEEEEAAGLS